MPRLQLSAHQVLDDVDQALLSILEADGRITNREISSRLGLSESATHARRRRLEGVGVIKGYTAIIDRGKQENGGHAWLMVSLFTGTAALRERLIVILKGEPDVRVVIEISGTADLMIEVAGETIEHVREVQRRLEQIAPSNIAIRVCIVLSVWALRSE